MQDSKEEKRQHGLVPETSRSSLTYSIPFKKKYNVIMSGSGIINRIF